MIKELTQKILSEFGLQVKIAGELEFHIDKPFASDALENKFLSMLMGNLAAANVPVWEMGKEVCETQFEISLQPQEPLTAAKHILLLKQIIRQTAHMICKPDFSAKPYDNLPGSGLHIHIGIKDVSGNSALERKDGRGSSEESDTMLHIIGGLCDTMLKNFIHFAPNENSYKRFSAERNNVAEEDKNKLAAYNNAPVNVSWGGNNRTTAIRIPASSYDESTRHIEHRVAGADADPVAAIQAVLEGIYEGLKNKLIPPEKIYGNAFLPQYNHLKPFPKTLEEAQKLHAQKLH